MKTIGEWQWRKLLMVGAMAWACQSEALINPNFTPGNLVEESQQIIVVTMKKGDREATFEATSQTALKGEKLTRLPVFDCNEALNDETKKFLAEHLDRTGALPGILFLGQFSDTDANAEMDPAEGEEADDKKIFLHVGAKWIDLVSGQDAATFGLVMPNAHMEGTWAGGSDMLLRAVKLRLADETVDFPVVAGASWQEPVQIGTVAGLRRLRAVDVDGGGKWQLFAMSDKGDRLFAYDEAAGKVQDVTATRKLTSKSVAAAWGDFSGDGRLDLASFDGRGLTLHVQTEQGAFSAKAVALPAEAAAACALLGVVGRQDRAGLVLGGGAAAWLCQDLLAEKPGVAPLAEGGAAGVELGKAVTLLVADLDGDNLAEALHIFEKGSLLYKGKGTALFAPAVKLDLSGGVASQAACLADFDCDGRLDIFAVSEDGSRIWQNEGDLMFKEYIGTSGEIAYISKPNSVDCVAADFNNDGMQDVLISYSNQGAQIFFNRGFRSFGHAHDLDMTENQLLPQGEGGQRAGCAVDLNHDGAQDMVLGLPDGEIWCFDRSSDDGDPLAAMAALSPTHPFKGPATVTGWFGGRLLGAWNVMPGTAEAFFGTREAGIVTVKWQLPGGAAQQQDMQLENKARRFELK